ncbi:MAG TPA: DUF4124 domain-containing protein [Burkholderiales bacterium]
MNARMLAAALMLALSASVQAQLYKWVDSEGKIHYSDQPPPAGANKEQKLNIKKAPTAPGAPTDADNPAGPQTTAEKEMEYRKRKVEEEQARQKTQSEEKQNQELCLNAQRRMRTYEDAGRIFIVDDKGEREYVDDESRERGMRQAQQDAAKYCK